MIRTHDVDVVIGTEDLKLVHDPGREVSIHERMDRLEAVVRMQEHRLRALEQRTWWQMFKDWSKPWLSRLIRFGK